jgi:DNA invertase Pin-like site-specific DNA recombinase
LKSHKLSPLEMSLCAKQALAACRATHSTLLVAKLDRLSRNLAFLANLMEAEADFVCCDTPHATPFTLHILAAVAEHERKMISAGTKAALAAAKAPRRQAGQPEPVARQCRGNG